MTHIDLFSGIGGFALAALWVGFKTEVFCEKDKFCQQVLQKRFRAVIANSSSIRLYSEENKQKLEKERSNQFYPCKSRGIPLIPDIRDFDGTKWRGATILTGGFPCQPFSVAGKRRGKEDDRYLWPEMFRVISEAKPTWVLGENVAGIVHLALDQVLTDLESEGYETATFIIPACAVNAPHRRDRVWIIAHHASDSSSQGLQKSGPNRIGKFPKKEKEEVDHRLKFKNWGIPWIEVATQLCGMDDGVSAELDGFKLSKSAHRRERLKALGNAIVPQIAMIIMTYIKTIEEKRRDHA